MLHAETVQEKKTVTHIVPAWSYIQPAHINTTCNHAFHWCHALDRVVITDTCTKLTETVLTCLSKCTLQDTIIHKLCFVIPVNGNNNMKCLGGGNNTLH